MVSHEAPENMEFALNWQEQGSCAQGAGTAWSPVAFKLSPIAAQYPPNTTGIILTAHPNETIPLHH